MHDEGKLRENYVSQENMLGRELVYVRLGFGRLRVGREG